MRVACAKQSTATCNAIFAEAAVTVSAGKTFLALRALVLPVAHAKNLSEESRLIEAGFEYVRFSDEDKVAIYRKRM